MSGWLLQFEYIRINLLCVCQLLYHAIRASPFQLKLICIMQFPELFITWTIQLRHCRINKLCLQQISSQIYNQLSKQLNLYIKTPYFSGLISNSMTFDGTQLQDSGIFSTAIVKQDCKVTERHQTE